MKHLSILSAGYHLLSLALVAACGDPVPRDYGQQDDAAKPAARQSTDREDGVERQADSAQVAEPALLPTNVVGEPSPEGAARDAGRATPARADTDAGLGAASTDTDAGLGAERVSADADAGPQAAEEPDALKLELCPAPELDGYAYSVAPDFWLGDQGWHTASVDGLGYLITYDAAAASFGYARTIELRVDPQGYLLTREGAAVLGVAVEGAACLSALRVPRLSLPRPTREVGIVANFDGTTEPRADAFDLASPSSSADFGRSLLVYNRRGEQMTVDLYFRVQANLEVDYTVLGVGTGKSWTLLGAGTLLFTSDGALRDHQQGDVCITSPDGAPQCIDFDFGRPLAEGGSGLAGSTLFESENTWSSVWQDGHSLCSGRRLHIGTAGEVQVDFGSCPDAAFAHLAMARFADESALEPGASPAYQETLASGPPLLGVSGDPGMGIVLSLD